MIKITLKPGREKSLLRRHPWVFSGAIAQVDGTPGIGETVEICNSHAGFLAWGAFSPESQIRVRVWSWNPEDVIAPEFFRSRLQAALDFRKSPVFSDQCSAVSDQLQVTDHWKLDSALRLVHAESDGFPGLVIDRYEDVLVMQVLSAGPELWKETIADLLLELTTARHIYERSDVDVRHLEGLAERVGPLRGDPSTEVIITEYGLRFAVNLSRGHKTGFYLDQCQNRQRVRQIAQGKEVLDCFAYSGGFGLNALLGGAQTVTIVDASNEALSLARKNLTLNNLPAEKVEWLAADVFQQLRKFRDQARQFDLIILDPPKFAPTASQAQKASRGYKDINLLAFKLLRPGGILVAFSCSGGISADLFQKIVAGAALDAGANAKIVEHLEQSPDHPVALNFPEGAYLKGLILQV